MKMISKKLCVFLSFVFLCAMAHASIVFQADAGFPGACGLRYEDCFETRNPVKTSLGFGLGDISFSAAWEFNSHDGERLHFFTGVDVGYFCCAHPVTLTFGTMFQLFRTELFSFELSGSLKAGPSFGWWGSVSVYLQPSVDLVMMGKSRRGFYGGMGITTIHSWNGAYYQDFGWNSRWDWFAGAHLFLGFRIL